MLKPTKLDNRNFLSSLDTTSHEVHHIFELAESDPQLGLVCDFYLSVADQLLANPEGVVPQELNDENLYRLLAANDQVETESSSNLDFMMV